MQKLSETKDFMRFLNRNYYIHSHLAERLDELKDAPLFSRCQKAISDTINLVERQLIKIEYLFDTLAAVSSLHEIRSTINYIESIFTIIQHQGNNTPVTALLDYVSIADALMATNAQLAKVSLYKLPELNLPDDHLYDIRNLQLLKILLNDILVAT